MFYKIFIALIRNIKYDLHGTRMHVAYAYFIRTDPIPNS